MFNFIVNSTRSRFGNFVKKQLSKLHNCEIMIKHMWLEKLQMPLGNVFKSLLAAVLDGLKKAPFL